MERYLFINTGYPTKYAHSVHCQFLRDSYKVFRRVLWISRLISSILYWFSFTSIPGIPWLITNAYWIPLWEVGHSSRTPWCQVNRQIFNSGTLIAFDIRNGDYEWEILGQSNKFEKHVMVYSIWSNKNLSVLIIYMSWKYSRVLLQRCPTNTMSHTAMQWPR